MISYEQYRQFYSLARNCSYKEMSTMLKNEIDIHDEIIITEDGMSITFATLGTQTEYPPLLEFLLKEGANPNLIDVYGLFPIQYAVQEEDMFNILIKYGANINFKTKKGIMFVEYLIQENKAHWIYSLYPQIDWTDISPKIQDEMKDIYDNLCLKEKLEQFDNSKASKLIKV